MRILVVIPSSMRLSKTNTNGLQVAAQMVADEMKKIGHEVTFMGEPDETFIGENLIDFFLG